MSANNLKFFDFEVFPNWWCCAVSDEEEHYSSTVYHNNFTEIDEKNIKDKMRVYTSDDPDAMTKLKADLSTGVICGYNIKKYDLLIAKCLFAGFSPQKLYKANNIIIEKEVDLSDPETVRIADFVRFGWRGCWSFQDLMDDVHKGLKDKECSLGMDIRETTVPFDKTDLTEQDKKDIIFYNKHDVYALHVYYASLAKNYIDTKMIICDIFGIDRKIGYTCTNAVLACKVLDVKRVHGTEVTDPTITIRDEDLKNYFEKWIPPEVYHHLLTSQENKTFNMYDNEVSVGDGGLHSVYTLPNGAALYVEGNDEWGLYDVDVSSCYTSVMVFCNSMSRAIQEPKKLEDIYRRRMKLKFMDKKLWTEDDKKFVPSAKLILNTIYGAQGNKYLPIYDDYMRTKVCRISQMILISLGMCLYTNIPELKVIQNNTDGIMVYMKKSYKPELDRYVKEFSDLSHFIFETDEFSKIWQLNVNNYLAEFMDGTIRDKGGAFVMDIYQPGYYHLRPMSTFCIPKAQKAFYVEKKNPVKELLTNTSVKDFCLSCTKGPGYSYMVQYNKDKREVLGKVSRVIAVENEEFGIIKKCKVIKTATKSLKVGDIKEDTVALCPPHALIVDDALYHYKIENGKVIKDDGQSWKIDYAYYARELDKALDITWYKMCNDNLAITKEFNL